MEIQVLTEIKLKIPNIGDDIAKKKYCSCSLYNINIYSKTNINPKDTLFYVTFYQTCYFRLKCSSDINYTLQFLISKVKDAP